MGSNATHDYYPGTTRRAIGMHEDGEEIDFGGHGKRKPPTLIEMRTD